MIIGTAAWVCLVVSGILVLIALAVVLTQSSTPPGPHLEVTDYNGYRVVGHGSQPTLTINELTTAMMMGGSPASPTTLNIKSKLVRVGPLGVTTARALTTGSIRSSSRSAISVAVAGRMTVDDSLLGPVISTADVRLSGDVNVDGTTWVSNTTNMPIMTPQVHGGGVVHSDMMVDTCDVAASTCDVRVDTPA